MYSNNRHPEEDVHHIDSLYDEIKVIRRQLLHRIEILEDEVEYLTKENMQYSRQLYQLECDIDSLLARISQRKTTHERLEYQESSKEINKESEETS
tara:strand:+ start:592 stop:879 length:288 start_codon:yes stop_codon:yes gene_type:complete